jgi:hypothetical protein
LTARGSFLKQEGLPGFSWHNTPKRGENVPDCHLCNYQMAITIYQMVRMAIEYNKLFHSKALQNLPKLGFLVWQYTIWQPWLRPSSAFREQIWLANRVTSWVC